MPFGIDDAKPQEELFKEYAEFGLSATDIVSMFAERRRFTYWRFDGTKVFFARNFSDLQDDARSDGQDGKAVLALDIGADEREAMHVELQAAFDRKTGLNKAFNIKPRGAAPGRFHLIAKFRAHADGSEDIFGVAFECFISARVISTS